LCRTLRKGGQKKERKRREETEKNRRSKTKGIVEGRFHYSQVRLCASAFVLPEERQVRE